MAALSREQLCNLGLAKIRAGTIAAFEENSLAARECRRFYPILLEIMLEGMEFSFATVRAALQAITNDRTGEWLYAYSLPANMGSAIAVLPDFEGYGLGLPLPLAGDPYFEVWSAGVANIETPYIIEGQTLYSNVESASLAYSINDIAGIPISHLVENAIATQLGAWLAVPVKADQAREAALLTQADLDWSRALADDKNRQPTQDGQFESEAMMARQHGVS